MKFESLRKILKKKIELKGKKQSKGERNLVALVYVYLYSIFIVYSVYCIVKIYAHIFVWGSCPNK